jgi:hypothetical protein
VVDTVKRGAVLLLVAFFLYWALSQPTAFADAVVALIEVIRDLLSSIAGMVDTLLSRLS